MKTADELLTMAWLTLTIYPARESTELVRQQIKEYLDAPKPEPVAWMFQHEDTGLIDYVDTQQVEWGFEKNNPRWQKIGPVFFHPPTKTAPRKPMTEEEIEEATRGHYNPYQRAEISFARAIERHHGIGEQE